VACLLCSTRKPRRYCPALRADICSLCCGQEREETVDCPLECEYLQESRYHDKLPDVQPEDIPNKDIRVTEDFLRENERLLLFTSGSLLQAALETPGAIDQDLKDCLDSMIQTYKTLGSGIYYDSRPTNTIAAAIYQRLQAGIQKFREDLAQQTGMQTIRDTDVLGIAVFLQRLEVQHNNRRRRSRAFIDFLRHYFADFQAAREQGELPPPPGGSSLLVP
jgi:hypothetical protein